MASQSPSSSRSCCGRVLATDWSRLRDKIERREQRSRLCWYLAIYEWFLTTWPSEEERALLYVGLFLLKFQDVRTVLGATVAKVDLDGVVSIQDKRSFVAIIYKGDITEGPIRDGLNDR